MPDNYQIRLYSDSQITTDRIRAEAALAGAYIVTPNQYGAVGNGTTNDYAAFNSAKTYCLTNGFPLLITAGTYYIGTTLDLSGVKLRFLRGGSIKLVSTDGIVLTVSDIEAGTFQIFEIDRFTDSNAPLFIDNRTTDILPEWFGADHTDTTLDNAPAIMQAHLAGGGGVVRYAGGYRIKTPVYIAPSSRAESKSSRGYAVYVDGEFTRTTTINVTATTGTYLSIDVGLYDLGNVPDTFTVSGQASASATAALFVTTHAAALLADYSVTVTANAAVLSFVTDQVNRIYTYLSGCAQPTDVEANPGFTKQTYYFSGDAYNTTSGSDSRSDFIFCNHPDKPRGIVNYYAVRVENYADSDVVVMKYDLQETQGADYVSISTSNTRLKSFIRSEGVGPVTFKNWNVGFTGANTYMTDYPIYVSADRGTVFESLNFRCTYMVKGLFLQGPVRFESGLIEHSPDTAIAPENGGAMWVLKPDDNGVPSIVNMKCQMRQLNTNLIYVDLTADSSAVYANDFIVDGSVFRNHTSDSTPGTAGKVLTIKGYDSVIKSFDASYFFQSDVTTAKKRRLLINKMNISDFLLRNDYAISNGLSAQVSERIPDLTYTFTLKLPYSHKPIDASTSNLNARSYLVMIAGRRTAAGTATVNAGGCLAFVTIANNSVSSANFDVQVTFLHQAYEGATPLWTIQATGGTDDDRTLQAVYASGSGGALRDISYWIQGINTENRLNT